MSQTCRPRLIFEANIVKFPHEKRDNSEPEPSLSEQERLENAFNHQTCNVKMLRLCPIIGNLDHLKKVDKAAVQFTEDSLQWTWSSAMNDHNSVIGDGLPLGYFYFLLDQLKIVGYSLVGKPEAVAASDVDPHSFVKMIYTFEQSEKQILRYKNKIRK